MILNLSKSTYLLSFLFTLKSLITFADFGIVNTEIKNNSVIITGADQIASYTDRLKDKKIGIVSNQTSILTTENNIHLVDKLISLKMNIKKVFSPEHGFRGKADAGELVKNNIDTKTKLPIISLYGKNKKPTIKQLSDIDVIIFDLQDVGVRFYTYISTLHYVMEACAENNIELIVLDRPNPNGHYVDGPVLEPKYKSFIGMHPVPVVYGMTIGEYAKMINGEKWLSNKITCNLTVVPLKNYNHSQRYTLPIKPSPNLPNSKSVNLYPSLCFFEGTTISCGRGTDKQFQVYGSPDIDRTYFSFTPKPNSGAKYPKHKNKQCFGESLNSVPYLSKINLSWLIFSQRQLKRKQKAFWLKNNFFNKLAGNNKLKQQVISGLSEEEIRKSWKKDVKKFKKIRKKYLLYP